MSVYSSCPGTMLCSFVSPGADDVSRAWLVWSGAAESALADAYQFVGGPFPPSRLVLGRGSALFRVVRLGGHMVRKARGNAADDHDAADVFLYRDSSVAPLLDVRRRFKVVMDVLGAMMVWCLSCSVGCAHCSLGKDSCCRSFISCYFGVIFIEWFLMFIIVSVISFMRLWFIAGMRLSGSGAIGFGRTLWCIPISGSGQT